MMSAECDLLRPDLGAFADGELAGAGRARVAQHLEVCDRCASELRALTEIGDLLRVAEPGEVPADLEGLASGVVSRIRAESAVSWRAIFDRAVDDWHWAVVATGSVSATFVVTAFLNLVLAIGPAPERADSLSALMMNLGSSPGILFVYATPGGAGGDSMLMQVDNGEPQPARVTTALAVPASYRTDRELVGAMADLMVREGRGVVLDAMNPDARKYVESLLDEISRRGLGDPVQVGARVAVHEVRLVTSTGVTARGL